MTGVFVLHTEYYLKYILLIIQYFSLVLDDFMEQVKDLNTFSSIAFFHLSQPQAPVSSGWHIHCQKLLCKWSSSLHNGRPRWHSCWTLSCSCSGCCVPCCHRPPQCSVEPPQRDPTCWGEHLSCSQLRFEDSWEYRVLETCKKKIQGWSYLGLFHS